MGQQGGHGVEGAHTTSDDCNKCVVLLGSMHGRPCLHAVSSGILTGVSGPVHGPDPGDLPRPRPSLEVQSSKAANLQVVDAGRGWWPVAAPAKAATPEHVPH